MTKDELINKLAVKAMEHRLVLFLGAGFSKAVLGDKVALSWLQLLDKVAKHFDLSDQLPTSGKSFPLDCPEVASRLCRSLFAKHSEDKTPATYAQCVEAIKRYTCRVSDWRLISGQGESSAGGNDSWAEQLYKMFKTLDPVLVITTNYDHVIESFLEGDCVSLSAGDVLTGIPSSRIPIYHLHGICDDPHNIVLTREDYVEATRPFSYRQSRLTALLRENSVLYVGYGKNDSNILSALDVAQHAFGDVDCSVGRFGKELHVQLIYPTDNDFPHQLYTKAMTECYRRDGQDFVSVEMLEYYTKDTIGFLRDFACRVEKMKDENKKACDNAVKQIDVWSENIPGNDDYKKCEERRMEYEQMLKNARSLLVSRSVVGQEVIKTFCNRLAAHYDKLKDYSNQEGQFIGYAYCWAFLSAYFQVLDDTAPYSLFSIYSTQFCDAVYLFNGLAKRMNTMEENNNREDNQRLPTSFFWLCYDWKHKLAPEVKIAILEQAELLADNASVENSIVRLIQRVEETIKTWR